MLNSLCKSSLITRIMCNKSAEMKEKRFPFMMIILITANSGKNTKKHGIHTLSLIITGEEVDSKANTLMYPRRELDVRSR